jgi:hypothetical protein
MFLIRWDCIFLRKYRSKREVYCCVTNSVFRTTVTIPGNMTATKTTWSYLTLRLIIISLISTVLGKIY